jgi:phosphatidylglycerol lysyltransferase
VPKRLRRFISPLLGLLLFAVAIYFLNKQFGSLHYDQVARQIHDFAPWQLILAVGLTCLSYFVLSCYDLLALHYLRLKLPPPLANLFGFIAYAFSNNIGHTLFGGLVVRYRLYSTRGLSTREITTIAFFCGLTFWLGFLTLAGTSFLVAPLTLPASLHIPFADTRPLGYIFLSLAAAYLLFAALRRRPLVIHHWAVHSPSLSIALGQLLLAVIDLAIAASVLFCLLPPGVVSPHAFLGIYLLSIAAGLISQVPGGLGVVELVLAAFLSDTVPADRLAATLLAFRAIYYFLPLLLATALLGGHELLQHRQDLRHALVARLRAYFSRSSGPQS